MIEEKVRRFIEDPASSQFNELALEAFAFQYGRLEPYRRLCERSGAEPKTVTDWRQIPPVPALAFKRLDLATRTPAEVFRSSGTTVGQRSVHRHGFLDLYRTAIDHSFPRAVLGETPSVAILSLIPTRSQAPDSSLSFMAEHILDRWGNADSVHAIGDRGVDARRLRSFLAARQRDRQPTLLLATALALIQALEALEKFDLRFRLPPGTTVFETGGYKGRRLATTPQELSERLQERLGVAASGVVREYGMTELTSQLYTSARTGRSPDVYLPPHWVRIRILDPVSLSEAPPGVSGLICLCDLANLSSAIQLLTEDLGSQEDSGLRLVGRAGGAELRGCSLTIEELSR